MSDKKQKERRAGLMKVRFSIGAKLILIITVIVVLSLGTIITLVSWLVRDDLRLAAEDNNYEVNRRSAMEAESTINNVRSNSRILIQTVDSLGYTSDLSQKAIQSFFNENRQIAALLYTSGSETGRTIFNEPFFNTRGINISLADTYWINNRQAFNRASAGETVALNAAPHFGASLIAIFFPWENGSAGVLFFPSSLNDTFGFGANQSYLLNNSADVLVHPDFELVRSGANFARLDFVQAINASADKNKQQLIEVDSDLVREKEPSGFLLAKWEEIKENALPLYNAAAGYFKKLLRIESNAPSSGGTGKVRMFMAYTKLNIAGAAVITVIEYDKVFEGINTTTRRNLLLTGAVLCISIILIWFFSKSISVPLKTLASAAKEIEGGTFEMEIKKHKGRDEIGVLNASFQRMCKALHIFGRFTNRDIAVRAMRGEIKPGGLPKHATIFFSDIRGFTEKAENFTHVFGNQASDHIVHWLNNYLTQMINCVEKTGGVVDKFIGDAVMAHWGTAYTAGTPQQDAYNCIAAALMMRKALYYMNKNRRANDPGDPPIRIGCGINTGTVTAGQIGSELRMEYTVIGDPVNLASRVEALTKPLGADILITEDTWNMVKYDFITEEMPSVTVKGKAKPVRIFAVVNSVGTNPQPSTLNEVRYLLGIKPPDLSKVNVNEDEKKYNFGAGVQR